MGMGFDESKGQVIVERLISVIHENKSYLSEIDGAIGDGDHGINMDKGFTKAEKELSGKEMGLSEAMKSLGTILVEEIGGSMGPLYGTFFKRMARASKGASVIDAEIILNMLESAYEGVKTLGNAEVGDKTLLDTLYPAVEAFKKSQSEGKDAVISIDEMIAAAEAGKDSTVDMVAKVGRASRLGERSRGVLDPGATSCYLLLKAFGDTIKELMT